MAKRSYSILRKQLAENPKTPTSGRRDSAAPDIIKKTILSDLFTVDADMSLRVLPSLIRRQIDEYLQNPAATTKAFALSYQSFDFRFTTRKEPATFVEMGTTTALDCGLYEFGVSRRSRIVVVKPRPGSTFNNGEPGIITFYGKGLKVDRVKRGRNIVSRWAIWTPGGIREDVLVERLVTGAPLIDSDDSDVVRPAQKKRRIVRKRSSHNDRHNSESLFVTPQPEEHNEPTADQSDKGQNLLVVNEAELDMIKQEFCAGGMSVRTSQPGNTACHEVMPMPANRRLMPQPSQTPDQTLYGCNTISTLGSAETLSRLSSAVPPAFVPVDNRTQKPINFEFKVRQGDTAGLKKTLTQCNTVQKMFAYAYKAGILRNNDVMLAASFGDQTHHIVRDDDPDFNELVRCTHNIRISAPEDTITIVVTPSSY